MNQLKQNCPETGKPNTPLFLIIVHWLFTAMMIGFTAALFAAEILDRKMTIIVISVGLVCHLITIIFFGVESVKQKQTRPD